MGSWNNFKGFMTQKWKVGYQGLDRCGDHAIFLRLSPQQAANITNLLNGIVFRLRTFLRKTFLDHVSPSPCNNNTMARVSRITSRKVTSSYMVASHRASWQSPRDMSEVGSPRFSESQLYHTSLTRVSSIVHLLLVSVLSGLDNSRR